MKIGVKVGAPIDRVTWANTRAMAVAAEEAGFDSIWVEDHHFEPNGGPLDAWTALGALAAITSRVQLAPIVASLNFYPSPVVLAHKVASLQDISAGRLILGVGAGDPAENARLGLLSDHPVGRFAEKFEVMRRLLAGERFSFKGKYLELDDVFLCATHPVDWVAGLPSTESPVPVEVEWMTGGLGERMLGVTLPYVAGWTTHWSIDAFWNDPERFRHLRVDIDKRLTEIGRAPRDVWRAAEVWIQMSAARGLPIPIPDGLVAAGGGGEAVAEYLHRCDEAGIDHLVVLLDPQTVGAVEELAEARARYLSGR